MDNGELEKIVLLKQEIEEVERSQVMARNKIIALLLSLGFEFSKNNDSPSILRLRLPCPVTGWSYNWYSFIEITTSGCYLEKDNTTLGEFKAEKFNVFETPDCNHGYDAYGGIRVDPGGIPTNKEMVVAIEMALKTKLENARKEEQRDWSYVRIFPGNE